MQKTAAVQALVFPIERELENGKLTILNNRGFNRDQYAAYYTMKEREGSSISMIGVGRTPVEAVDNIGFPPRRR